MLVDETPHLWKKQSVLLFFRAFSWAPARTALRFGSLLARSPSSSLSSSFLLLVCLRLLEQRLGSVRRLRRALLRRTLLSRILLSRTPLTPTQLSQLFRMVLLRLLRHRTPLRQMPWPRLRCIRCRERWRRLRELRFPTRR